MKNPFPTLASISHPQKPKISPFERASKFHRADTIRGEHLPRLWPYSDSTSGSPTKKAKTSEPGESSRALGIHSLSFLPLGALDPARPLRATQIADPEHFMSRHILITLFCASRLSCGIHTVYLRGTICAFMTPPQFFYPRVALDFYQSMTTRGVPVPASILFTINGRQGILGARQIAEAFHIPYAPADPTAFRLWAPLSEWDMVRILSRATSAQRTIFRRELPPGMLLVDVVLRANLFPLQHRVQRRGAILEAFFEKVHKRRLSRAASIQLLFPRLLCHVLAHMGFPIDPQFEPRRHCRESFALEQWNQVWLHQHSPELPEPREVPHAPYTSAPSEPVPEAASSDAHPLFLIPQSRPSLSLVQSTMPCSLLSRL
ncbi:hypothetical protein CK203_114227 [Vitis vinifera]|uniref:Uncharacterized protein n=1 Tax=Vitis vinifera TaxID=29760 RepID=A0A438CA81_VITVI|nr:hypothetical protein CK203_114227 [Vitis vinifera]